MSITRVSTSPELEIPLGYMTTTSPSCYTGAVLSATDANKYEIIQSGDYYELELKQLPTGEISTDTTISFRIDLTKSGGGEPVSVHVSVTWVYLGCWDGTSITVAALPDQRIYPDSGQTRVAPTICQDPDADP